MPEVVVDLQLDTTEIDKTIEKTHKLIEVLKEAKSLIDDLASSDINITLEMQHKV